MMGKLKDLLEDIQANADLDAITYTRVEMMLEQLADPARIEVDRGRLKKYIRNVMEVAKPIIFAEETTITDVGIENIIAYLEGE